MEDFYVGLDVGSSNIHAGVAGDEVYEDSFREVPTEEYWTDQGLYSLAAETAEYAGVDPEDIEGIGIGVPGLVDSEGMVYAEPLEELEFDALEDLAAVRFENDGNAAVLGEEVYGAGGDDLVSVVIGSGIGGGAVKNGELLSRKDGGGSPEPAGVYAGDGESWGVLGGDNLPLYAEMRRRETERESELSRKPSSEEVFSLHGEDPVATEILEDLSEINARGIAAITNILGPEKITFSGSVAVENPGFMESSFEKVDSYAVNPVPDLEISRLGNDLGVYGSLAVARSPENGF